MCNLADALQVDSEWLFATYEPLIFCPDAFQLCDACIPKLV